MKREKLIHDRHGRILKFSQERCDELVYFKLDHAGACAAYAHGRIDGAVLVITDLFVESNCVIRQPDFLKRLFGQKTSAINFQNQGIDSQLVITMITYARSKGLTHIENRWPENDVRRDSPLAQWFQKRGFKADEASMKMDLKAPAHDDSKYMPKP
jgi:hypothetical protein